MAYTPENNPFIPGDPYSYDLKWVVNEIDKWKTSEDAVEEATAQADRAKDEADRAKEKADDAAESAADALDSELAAKDYADHIADPVSGLVTDWLADHISQPTTPAIDTSLSIPGAAADAKATGDAIASIENSTDSLLPQKIKNGNFAEGLTDWDKNFASLSVSSGEMTVTVANQSNCQFFQNDVIYKKGHVYVLIATIKASQNGTIAFVDSDTTFHKLDITTSFQTFKSRFSAFTNTLDKAFFYINHTNTGQMYPIGSNVVFTNLMLFDLTEIFGFGNEPGTDQFYYMLSQTFIPYYDPDIFPIENILSYVKKESGIKKINRFDKTRITPGVYVDNSTGATSNYNPSYFTSDFIDVSDVTDIWYTGTWRVAGYKNDFTFDQMLTGNSVGTLVSVSKPNTTAYIRISNDMSYLATIQVSDESFDINNITPFEKYTLTNLSEANTVIVSKSGASSYTSLLEALMTTDKDIIVRDGDFDIVDEYKTKFGNTFFNVGFDRSVAGDFALGLYVDHRKVTFMADTSVAFDLTGIDVSYDPLDDRRFSLFWMGLDAEIHGLTAEVTNNWYAIHDDVADADLLKPFTNKIVDCVIDSYNTVNTNVIGGGCGAYSTTIIDNCYLDNHVNDITTRTLRYHNTWHPYAKPVIRVSRTYVNGRMYFGYYGSSTKEGIVQVNNCSMANTIELLPVDPSSVLNLRLIQYSNETR